jgi:hypothetical protein
MDPADITRNILMYFILPLRLAACLPIIYVTGPLILN